MIATEQEARTKRCQEGFAAAESITHDGALLYTPGSPVSYASVAVAVGGAPLNCLASGCMAWRWFDNTDDQAIKEPRGYCGKAGRP